MKIGKQASGYGKYSTPCTRIDMYFSSSLKKKVQSELDPYLQLFKRRQCFENFRSEHCKVIVFQISAHVKMDAQKEKEEEEEEKERITLPGSCFGTQTRFSFFHSTTTTFRSPKSLKGQRGRDRKWRICIV